MDRLFGIVMVAGDLRRLWFATLFLYVASGFVFPIFPVYMSFRRLGAFEIGLVVSVATLLSIFPVAVIGHVSDIVDRERFEGALGFILCFLVLLYVFVGSFVQFLFLASDLYNFGLCVYDSFWSYSY